MRALPCQLLVAAVPGLFPVQLAPATAMRAAPIIFSLQCLVAGVLAVQAGGLGACYGAQGLLAVPLQWLAVLEVPLL